MAKKTKNFLKGLKSGALTKQAKRAGFNSWKSYCNSGDLSKLAKKRCTLAKSMGKWK